MEYTKSSLNLKMSLASLNNESSLYKNQLYFNILKTNNWTLEFLKIAAISSFIIYQNYKL